MFGFIGNIGTSELIIVLLVAVVVIGPSKLPEVARTVGKVIRDIQEATSGVRKDFEEALDLDNMLEPKSRTKTLKNAIKVTGTDEPPDLNGDSLAESSPEPDSAFRPDHEQVIINNELKADDKGRGSDQ